MKLKDLLQGSGLVSVLIGALWIILKPNYRYELTAFLIEGDTTYTCLTASLDMPWALALLFVGIILALIAIFIPDKEIKIE